MLFPQMWLLFICSQEPFIVYPYLVGSILIHVEGVETHEAQGGYRDQLPVVQRQTAVTAA